MAESRTIEPDWMQWASIIRRIVGLKRQGQFGVAFAELNTFLGQGQNPEIQSDALGFRAELREQTGDLEGAKLDLIAARESVNASYARYVHEICLGDLCRKQQQEDQAIAWYRTALQTSIEADGVSCGSALGGLLKSHVRGGLSPEDCALCEQAAERSWHLLGLTEAPDFSNLEKLAATISHAEANPPRPASQ